MTEEKLWQSPGLMMSDKDRQNLVYEHNNDSKRDKKKQPHYTINKNMPQIRKLEQLQKLQTKLRNKKNI